MILTGIMDLAVNVFRKEGHGEKAMVRQQLIRLNSCNTLSEIWR